LHLFLTLVALVWILAWGGARDARAASQACPSDSISSSYNDYWDQVTESYGVSGDAIPGTNPTLSNFIGTYLGVKKDSDDDRALFQNEKALWSDGVMAAETTGTLPRTEYRWQSGTTWEYSWDHVKYFGDPAVIQDFRMVIYFYEKTAFSGTGNWIIMAYDPDDDSVDTTVDLDGAGNYYVTVPYNPVVSACGGLDETSTPVSIRYQEFDLTALMSRLSSAGYDNVELRMKAVHDSGAGPAPVLLTQEVELAVTIGGGPVTGRVTICSDCHDYPPSDAPGGTRNTPPGAVAGSHQAHSGWTCETCHSNVPTEPIHGPTGFGHFDRNIDMAASILGGTYSKGISFPIDPDVTPLGLGTCDTVSCHYSLNPGPTWGGASMTCTSCHGQPPTAGSHTQHYTTGMTTAVTWDCDTATCHVKPATNVAANHPDGTVQQGCTNTQCHNPTAYFTANAIGSNPTPTWGSGPANCGWCHDNPPTTSTLYNHSGVAAATGSNTPCTGCHGHSGTDAGNSAHLDGSYSPPVLACNSCHGYPPLTDGGANDKHVGVNPVNTN